MEDEINEEEILKIFGTKRAAIRKSPPALFFKKKPYFNPNHSKSLYDTSRILTLIQISGRLQKDSEHFSFLEIMKTQEDGFSPDASKTQDYQKYLDQIGFLDIAMRILAASISYLDDLRVVVPMNPETSAAQYGWLRNRLNKIRPHKKSFGFAFRRSAIQCAQSHNDAQANGVVPLLIKVDIENFFNSFSEPQIRQALIAHNFTPEESNEIIKVCMLPPMQEDEVTTKYILNYLFYSILTNVIQRSTGQGAKRSLPADRIKRLANCLSDFIFTALVFFTQQRIGTTDNFTPKELLIKSLWDFGNRKFNRDKMATLILEAMYKIAKCGPKVNPLHGQRLLFQGGCCSPALTNIAFKVMDYRLDGYANKCGAHYARYADDLTFSFPSRRTTKQINIFISGIGKLLKSEGFVVNQGKIKVLGRGAPQQVVGYCINSGKPTINRRYRDAVKREVSEIRNAGALSDKVAQVRGRIAHIATAHPRLGEALMAQTDGIANTTFRRSINI